MKQAIRWAGAGLAAVIMTGCAATSHEGSMQVTHEWVASDRVAQVQFSNNEQECTQDARSVNDYEQCMTARGYQRYDQ